jgi:hypothetical protein
MTYGEYAPLLLIVGEQKGLVAGFLEVVTERASTVPRVWVAFNKGAADSTGRWGPGREKMSDRGGVACCTELFFLVVEDSTLSKKSDSLNAPTIGSEALQVGSKAGDAAGCQAQRVKPPKKDEIASPKSIKIEPLLQLFHADKMPRQSHALSSIGQEAAALSWSE